ncbi:hypothetical protein LP414_16185 [Polaromonas sp. P1(28)-13]|nr:hypothetical protein LP414_16185 [Polaromonas sp. P1(28)-13]
MEDAEDFRSFVTPARYRRGAVPPRLGRSFIQARVSKVPNVRFPEGLTLYAVFKIPHDRQEGHQVTGQMQGVFDLTKSPAHRDQIASAAEGAERRDLLIVCYKNNSYLRPFLLGWWPI